METKLKKSNFQEIGLSAGPDPDIAPLGGHQFWRGVKGPPRPLWVQGKALVGGSGGEAPRSKTIFSILNAFGELSFIMFLAYFFIFRE